MCIASCHGVVYTCYPHWTQNAWKNNTKAEICIDVCCCCLLYSRLAVFCCSAISSCVRSATMTSKCFEYFSICKCVSWQCCVRCTVTNYVPSHTTYHDHHHVYRAFPDRVDAIESLFEVVKGGAGGRHRGPTTMDQLSPGKREQCY